MAKIEHGRGVLMSVDTDKKTLKFRETVAQKGRAKREWELPYSLEWQDQKFFHLVGTTVRYVTSDGSVASLA